VKLFFPFQVGQKVKQETKVASIDSKKGSRGDTIFVTVEQNFSNENGLSLVEFRTLAYMKEKMDLDKMKPIQGSFFFSSFCSWSFD
jgi:hydroxyacyl-ACP dehydratase HTD2-like protein with hotdog domain